MGGRRKQRIQGGEGVRQECIISPILFNVFSEFMIRETLEGIEGVKIGGEKNIPDLRSANDAVLVAYSIGKMQRMMDSLSETCNVYGMEINFKKTKVIVVGDTGETDEGCAA